MLSLIIPAYNEALRLSDALASTRTYFDAANEPYEVIVVDDGSTDTTAALVEAAAREWPQLSLLRLPHNQGKGAAVRAGMLKASGDERAFSDADFSTPLTELAKLRSHLKGDCTVAIASRAVVDSRVEVSQPWHREMMGRAYNRLLQALVLPGIRDSQCGFKVFTAQAAVACFEPLRTLRFGFDAEVLARARSHGWTVAEVPVRWRHVDASKVSPVKDSFRTLLDLLWLRRHRGA